MRLLLIGNPVAGQGRGRRRIAALAAALESRGHDLEVFLTHAAGDAAARAATVGLEVERLIVAGGDGTLNEVLNGLADPSARPLLQLPLGTANVLARELGLPRRPEQVARLVEEGVVRRLDMGLLGDRRFVALASAGFDAMVVHRIARSRKGGLGFRGYVLPILHTLRRYRPPQLRVTVDGASVTGALVVVSNIRNYGGIFRVTDRARCDSGCLDICVMHRGSLPALLGYGWTALFGRMSRRRDITYLTGRHVRIDAADPVAVEVDGDYFGQTPVEVTLQPAAVPLVVPPGSDR